MRHIALCFVSLLLGLSAAAAVAAVTGVTAAPATERAALARATSLAVNWSVTTNSAGSVTVSSALGRFFAPGGALIGSVNQPLSKTVAGPATVAFAENLIVPAAVVERARREGHDHFFYRRSFTDGVAANGEIRLNIATAQAARFGVSRIALALDDGKPAAVIDPDETVRARAEVSFTGSGLVRGAWEVAGPNANPDEPAWRVLAEVNQALTGAETAALVSPPLPAAITGFYMVRLRVAEPAVAFELPDVRYFVRQE